jgi:PPK2 family polyphosphate:nucleotide phosphotransferase
MKLDALRIAPGHKFRAADIDPAESSFAPGDKDETVAATTALRTRIGELQELLYAEHRRRVLVILQGMDTSGKDGATRKVFSETSPQGLRVASFKKPTQTELEHDYLWRIHPQVPGSGEIVVFNRSHYEDVLVVRVHSLVPREIWRKRYDHIAGFERMLADEGTTILKFFLHISPDEQRERLQARLEDPTKRWKFQHGDLEERRKWNAYMRAYEDAITRTSTKWAPWIVVPADRKWVRDYVVATFTARAMEALKMKYPQPDLKGVKVT